MFDLSSAKVCKLTLRYGRPMSFSKFTAVMLLEKKMSIHPVERQLQGPTHGKPEMGRPIPLRGKISQARCPSKRIRCLRRADESCTLLKRRGIREKIFNSRDQERTMTSKLG